MKRFASTLSFFSFLFIEMLLAHSAGYAQGVYDPENFEPVAANGTSSSSKTLSYNGGPVISALEIYSVLWGPNVNPVVAGNMPIFFNDLVTSNWITGFAAYNTTGLSSGTNQTIGMGTYAGQYQITPSISSQSITDSQIQAELKAQIAAGHLPAPKELNGYINTIYVIEFPPNLSITMGGYHSCVDFCAYHSDSVYGPNNIAFMYAVQPDFTTNGCRCNSVNGLLADQQSVHSHEIGEAITDPEVGLNITSWYNNAYGEIGDICSWQESTVVLNGHTYTVQNMWCNATNSCLPLLPGASVGNVVSASTSTVVAVPTTVAADGQKTATITVTLKTSSGVAVSGKAVTLSASSGSSVITTVSGTTNASGVATFTVKDSSAESVTYTAVDQTDSITIANTATVTFATVLTVSPSNSLVTASPSTVIANGTAKSTITVTLKTSLGAPVQGKSVKLSGNSGSHSTISPSSVVTNASGVATFTVKNSSTETVTYTAKDITDNLKVTGTATVQFVKSGGTNKGKNAISENEGNPQGHGGTNPKPSNDKWKNVGPQHHALAKGVALSSLSSAVSPERSTVVATASIVGKNASSQIIVSLKDRLGRPVSAKLVSLRVSGGNSVVTPLSVITDKDGVAVFTVAGDGEPETVVYTAYDVTDDILLTETAEVVFKGLMMLR